MDVPHLSHFPHGPIDAPTPHHLSDGTQTPKPDPLRRQALGVRCWWFVPGLVGIKLAVYTGKYFLYTIYCVFPLSNNFDRVVIL